LGASLVTDTAIGGILLLIVAGLLPWLLAAIPSVAWLISQNVLLTLVIVRMPGLDLADATVNGGLFLGISLFVFMGSVAGVRQSEARDELRKLNHELLATQALLAENTRIAERVRIARELHDLVGHHLTALTLNLEVVTHLVEGKALEHVQQAHSLAKLLLADVREVVSDMRQDDKVDLARALMTLVEGVPEPRVHLDLPSDMVMTDPQRAQVLLRCAQEIITNSIRHADAANLWLEFTRDGGHVSLKAHDDGCGTRNVHAGSGLTGMRDRLRELGGSVRFSSRPMQGFQVDIHLPLLEPAP
jgi:signal transduction histidine kinase